MDPQEQLRQLRARMAQREAAEAAFRQQQAANMTAAQAEYARAHAPQPTFAAPPVTPPAPGPVEAPTPVDNPNAALGHDTDPTAAGEAAHVTAVRYNPRSNPLVNSSDLSVAAMANTANSAYRGARGMAPHAENRASEMASAASVARFADAYAQVHESELRHQGVDPASLDDDARQQAYHEFMNRQMDRLAHAGAPPGHHAIDERTQTLADINAQWNDRRNHASSEYLQELRLRRRAVLNNLPYPAISGTNSAQWPYRPEGLPEDAPELHLDRLAPVMAHPKYTQVQAFGERNAAGQMQRGLWTHPMADDHSINLRGYPERILDDDDQVIPHYQETTPQYANGPAYAGAPQPLGSTTGAIAPAATYAPRGHGATQMPLWMNTMANSSDAVPTDFTPDDFNYYSPAASPAPSRSGPIRGLQHSLATPYTRPPPSLALRRPTIAAALTSAGRQAQSAQAAGLAAASRGARR